MAKPNKRSDDILREVLENLRWPPGLDGEAVYERLHDDHDGTREGRLIVQFSPDGDAWLRTDKHRGPTLRFGGSFGGGNSPRVRNALVLLALAIKLDNEEKPE